MKLQLIDDWKRVLRMAWSVKFAFLTAVAAFLETLLPVFPGLMSPGVFAKVALVSSALTILARVTTQLGMHDEPTRK